MAFEGLSERLGKVFKTLRGKGKLSEKDVRDAMREVKTALLEADVNFKITKDFTAAVTERAVGARVMESLTPGQQVIDIVHEELVKLLGQPDNRINFPQKPPCVIMMCGLQGAGKTTHSAKLAKHLKSMNRRPLLAACDVYRPAATEQLKIIGEKAGAKVFSLPGADPVKIAEESVRFAKDNGYDAVILDTAGRLHIDDALMNELEKIRDKTAPNEILLVIDSMTGQDAVNAAKAFNDRIELSGVILTKLDGDTRGGAALSVLGVTGKQIKFVGTGEKIDDLERYYPDRMASRILGMGDMLSLIEKAKQNFDEKEQEKIVKKMRQNRFDFNDLYSQYKQIEKMGSLSSILGMFPGIGGKIREEDVDQRVLTRAKAIIESMTKKEREKPSLIDAKRKRRIAAGSGTKVEDVNVLLKQMDAMQTMMKRLKGGKLPKFPKGFNPDGFGV